MVEVLNSSLYEVGFCCITLQSGFLMIEVSLSLNACMCVVYLITVQWLFTGSLYSSTAHLP